MIQSMTGFATTTMTVTTSSGSASATLTIKSLNNRFFDVTCKLPYAISHLETEMIRLSKKMLHRGSVYISLYISNSHVLKSNVHVSIPLAEAYASAIQTLQTKLNIPGTLNIADFITLPNLFEPSDEVNLADDTTASIMNAFEQLLHTLIATREQEGAMLQKDLEGRIQNMHHALDQIKPRAQIVAEERKTLFVEEVKKAISGIQQELVEPQLQMLYNAFEKKDVHEEIVRFTSHLNNFVATLHDNQPQKGKKLDFILQEMFREINTLGAKLTTDTQTTNEVISIKGELEKAKEQVQNII